MGLLINTILMLMLFFTSWGKAQETQGNLPPFYLVIYPGIPDGPTQLFKETELNNIPTLLRTRHRQYKYKKSFLNAYSQIQKLLIVRDYLIPIVESYANTLTQYNEQTEAFSKLQQLKEYILTERKYKTLLHPENIYFEFGETRFQVEGVDPTRLAINTGDIIIFNGEALAARSFSVEELFQIWMHEIFHLDPLTLLREKDFWISKVTQWVRERSQQIELKKNHRMTMLFLPQVIKEIITPGVTNYSYPNNQYWPSVEEHRKLENQSHLLIIQEDPDRTVLAKKLYNAIQDYTSHPNNESTVVGNSQFKGYIIWPYTESIKMQKRTNGSVQLAVTQKSFFYEANGDNYFSYAHSHVHSDISILPSIPKETFNIFYNPFDFSTEVQRSYTVPLPDADFEVQKITDTNKERNITVRLNIPDSGNILNKISTIHLLARDLETKTKLSINITQYQLINTDEILLEFKVPQRNITINQLNVPLTNSEGLYHELALRPSKPQVLYGSNSLDVSEFETKSFIINNKKNKNDSLTAKIQLISKKVITGLTLEVDQVAQANRVDWLNGTQDQQKHVNLGYIGIGRKFYFEQKDLKIQSTPNQSTITLSLPESTVSLIQNGPKKTLSSFSWAYELPVQYKAETLTDTHKRSVINAWVHFSDGSYEKIEKSKLPENFSLISQQEERIQKKKEKSSSLNWQERRKMFDLDIQVKDFFEEAKPIELPLQCRKIFKE